MWSWARTRDWRAGFVVVPFLVMWLPWFVVSRPQFFFYVLPMTPFMALAAVYTLQALSDARLVLHDEAGDVAIDPETGLPAISTRHPFRPVVMGYSRSSSSCSSGSGRCWWASASPRRSVRLHIWMRRWN